MEEFDIFQDIAQRTGGDLYVGVVGPVRTGKSTLIKRFLELLVLPNIPDEYERQRTTDEMPQSGAGRTIMTAEPKFIPGEAVEIAVGELLRARVRFIDCVGYPVEGAIGYEEEDGPRLVSTPWFGEPIPFEQAAEEGTRRVIAEHSTIGLVVTTDGSITDIPRSGYEEAERRTIGELKDLGKPFLVILNSAHPDDPDTEELANRMEQEYGATVLPVDALHLDREALDWILEELLYEFPVHDLEIQLPAWVQELEGSHWLRLRFDQAVQEARSKVLRLRDVDQAVAELSTMEEVSEARIARMEPGTGNVTVALEAPESLFYRVLEEIAGVSISDKPALMRLMRELVDARRQFSKLSAGWREAQEVGYGIVTPASEDMEFEEPELVKRGSQFGVRLRAKAPAYHVVRADVFAEYTPILGTEQQSEELVSYLNEKFADDPSKIWESEIFGKSLHELLEEGVQAKLDRIPENAQRKLRETLERITNEGSGGLICIIF
ncbi:MAG: stage IV sporulation protein A [Bacillota bacterium]|nr:stage IV sporulation protein A [Bacillota bacterium]